MLKRIKFLGESGDTIVEVLFAVVVIGLVLTGGYAVVNRSLLAEVDAQEHSVALGLTQTQLELLRTYILNNPTVSLPFNTVGASACIDPSTGQPALTNSTCAITTSTTSPVYQVSIVLNPTSKIYTVSTSWPSPTGNNNDNISIPYRIEQYAN